MLTINKTENGDQTTFALAGRLDAGAAQQLEAELQPTFRHTKTLVFDLRDLQFIATPGLRVLLSAQKQMNRQGRMRLTGVGEAVMQRIETKGLADIFHISDTE